MADFTIKQNDTSPSFQKTLQDSSGSAVDLTGASVQFHLYTQDKVTEKINTSATLTDAANGVVTYEWSASDTDTSGWYWGEFEVTYSDSSVETFPNGDYISIKIIPNLA